MTTIPLSKAPDGLKNPSAWVDGEPGVVAVGDLWLLSWDGHGLGVAVISARMDGYLLVWPVALPADGAHAPAVHVAESPLGVPVDVWPTRETGVGSALLHRRLGHLLDPRLMVTIGDALDEGRHPPLPFAPWAPDAKAQRRYDEDMIDHWEAICLTQWPAPSRGAWRLSPDVARELRLAPSQVADLLGLEAAEAVALVSGETDLTPAQVDALVLHLSVPLERLTTPARNSAVAALLDPTWKADVLEVANRRGLDEADARDMVVSEFALAARSSNTTDRLHAAFARLLDG